MCICFTLSQQDNYKCCLYCSSRLGNVLVTVKATKHMSSRLCADTWLAEYMQEPESGKFFSWRWWMLFCPTELAMGLTWALIWPWAVPGSIQNDTYTSLTSLPHGMPVGTLRILIVWKFLLPPALGSLLIPKAPMGPSIWDRLWVELEQVAHSVFQN